MLNSDNKIYVGDIGLAILVDVGADISDATEATLSVRKPDGTEVSWAAEVRTVSGQTNFLRHVTVPGDLDVPGKYRVQPNLTIAGGWSGLGETDTFRVYDTFR
jgi:hypothetical protein